jgi:TM2 domain-containing membrane protein YozV
MLLGRLIIICVVPALAGVPNARAEPLPISPIRDAANASGFPGGIGFSGGTGDLAVAVVRDRADPIPDVCHCDGVGLARDAARGAAASAHGSRAGALFRSLLVPGYGQLYNDQPLKGGIVLGAEIALLSTALAFHLAGDSVLSAYSRQARAQVSTDPTGQVQQLYESAQARYRVRDALLFTATSIWALNLADAYLSGGKGFRGRLILESGRAGPTSDRGLAPLAAIRPGHVILGVQGRF